MKVCVAGGDGYCGWATALHLSRRGHQVAIADNFARRQWDYELGVQTLTPIRPMAERLRAWKQLTGESIELLAGDLTDYEFITSVAVMVLALLAQAFRRPSEFELPVLMAVLLFGSGLVFVRVIERWL